MRERASENPAMSIRTDYKADLEATSRVATGFAPPAKRDSSLPEAPPIAGPAISGLVSTCGKMLHEEGEHGRRFLFIPVFLGVGAAAWFSATEEPPFWLLSAGFIACALVVLKLRHADDMAQRAALAALLILGGAVLAATESWRLQTVILDLPVTATVTARIDRREAAGTGRWRYLVHILDTEKPSLKRPPKQVSLLMRGQITPFDTGTVVKGRARLSPPSGPALPGLNDFAFSAYFDGIGAYGFWLGKPEAIDTPADTDRTGFLQSITLFFFDLRSGIGDRIRTIVPGDAGAFAAAIVTDERRAMSEETTEALRLSGLAHIIAISGLNMALAAGIFFVGVRSIFSLFPGFTQRYPVKKFAAAGALIMVCAYYLVSGFAVSAERAFLMMAILLIAALVDRPSISLRNVALAAIVILTMAPSEIMGPSFQMSFAATLALVSGYSLWSGHSSGREHARRPISNLASGTWNFVASVFLTSLIGSLSTSVFSVEHFHKLATYGLAANLAAMPVISFIVMPAGLIGMLLMPFGLETWPILVMGWGLGIVIDIAKTVASWGGELAIGRQPPLFLPLATAGMVLFLLLRTRLRHLGTGLFLLALATSLLAAPQKPDLLVSEDGRLVALLDGDSLNSNRRKPGAFIFDQWRRALTIHTHGPPEQLDSAFPAIGPWSERRKQPLEEEELIDADMLRQQILETAGDRRFTCVRQKWCLAKTDIGPVMVLEDGRYIGFACDHARLIVTPTRAKFARCRSGATILDSETLRQTGAVEITFAANVRQSLHIRPAFDPDTRRAWTQHRAYSWRDDDYTHRLPADIRMLLSDSGG